MKTKVAIVGLGKMGLMHASVMAMFNDVEIAAICEKNAFIRKFGKKAIPAIDIVENLEALLGRNLDALCITTPPASHYTIIKAALEKGLAKHIFTEKPLAVNFPQAKELCELAKKYGGVNMVGYHRRFSVTFLKAKELLDTGAIGKLISFKGHAYSADFLGAKTAKAAIGRGGVIEDSGCHVIDIALWTLGDMKVTGAEVKSIIGGGSEDEASLQVVTDGDLKGELNASWCKEGYRLPDMSLTVIGDNGYLSVNEDMVQLTTKDGKSNTWYKHDLNDTVPFSIGGNEYQRQDALFVKGVREGVKVEPDFRTAAKVHQLVDQANMFTRSLNE
jgi:predicted dehydrogenase